VRDRINHISPISRYLNEGIFGDSLSSNRGNFEATLLYGDSGQVALRGFDHGRRGIADM